MRKVTRVEHSDIAATRDESQSPNELRTILGDNAERSISHLRTPVTVDQGHSLVMRATAPDHGAPHRGTGRGNADGP